MKIAVIGAGRMGRRHLEVAERLGMDVCGVSDVSADAVRVACHERSLGRNVMFSDARTMIAKTGPEAIVVATTAPSHCEYVVDAARSGVRFILCEKPMAVAAKEVDLMNEACKRFGVRLAVNHQMRFMPKYVEVKRLVESVEYGGLVSIVVVGSNFGLAMNGSHYFEMFRYMTGTNVDIVQAWFDEERVPNPRGDMFEDRAGRLRASNDRGISMYMEFTAGAGHGLQVIYTTRYGQIVVDELSGYMRSTRRQERYRNRATTLYGMPALVDVQEMSPPEVIGPTEAVWRAMLADEQYPDGEVGGHAVMCLLAAHTSDENGHAPIRLSSPVIDRERRFPWA